MPSQAADMKPHAANWRTTPTTLGQTILEIPCVTALFAPQLNVATGAATIHRQGLQLQFEIRGDGRNFRRILVNRHVPGAAVTENEVSYRHIHSQLGHSFRHCVGTLSLLCHTDRHQSV